MVKRIVDIVLAAIALVALAPLVFLIALAIFACMGRPVFFCQQRPGLHGKPFTLIKFRTLTDERDSRGMVLGDAARLTRLGRWLRRASLDELPQLFNVLKGDMSLVGPRPLLMEYLPLYSPHQARRHEVRPGLTGWAQVNGRNALTWERKFDCDVWYVDNRTIGLDLKILWLSISKVCRGEGVSQNGHVTMERFRGGVQ